jgi:hypothetical protein
MTMMRWWAYSDPKETRTPVEEMIVREEARANRDVVGMSHSDWTGECDGGELEVMELSEVAWRTTLIGLMVSDERMDPWRRRNDILGNVVTDLVDLWLV